MGQRPTHPELLDYLAAELIRSGWSLKAMHRQMVLSSTYRMASRGDPEAEQLDPRNRLLHRMPVRRLEAEAIRDAILAVAGSLNRQMYGPSVPPHLTPFLDGRGRPESSGPLDGAGRRSLYINVRRNFLTPMFQAFDYPAPFTTIGRRSVSNVPAQALTLMNGPFVVQQAEAWAERVQGSSRLDVAGGVADLYRAAFARPPSDTELEQALAFLQDQQRRYATDRAAALAWADLCHVLFNAKEFLFVH
jgi:hypothetical protein